MTITPTSQPATPIAEDERTLAAALQSAMTTLHQVIEHETSFIRSGDLLGSTKLGSEKSEASRGYVVAVTKAQKNQRKMTRLLPDVVQSLQAQHERLRAALQVNLTVLATAQAVSEAVIRGVNSEVQKRAMPQTYTSYGQRRAPGPRNVVPIAVSRTL